MPGYLEDYMPDWLENDTNTKDKLLNAGVILQSGMDIYNAWNNQLGKRQQIWDLARLQVNQAVEKRGGLRLNFASTRDAANGRINWLPFYENPTIVESRRANYARQNVFLRNEPVRLYTGSEARKFKVDIHYTLPHIASMVPTNQLLQMFSNDTVLSDEDLLAIDNYLRDVVFQDTNTVSFNQDNMSKAVADNPNFEASAYLDVMRNRQSDGSEGPVGKFFDQGNTASIWNNYLGYILRTSNNWTQISKIVMYAINMIRASVIGSASFPVKGPPIVELKWGSLYNFVPCVVTDYRIQAVEEAGYDTKSLMAQRLKISMSLEEMRNVHGNHHGDPQVTGNLPGWDSIISLGSMDPVQVPDEEF